MIKINKILINTIKIIFQFIIFLYSYIISPFTLASCRFLPTCSEYSNISIKRFGLFKGFILILSRLIRCNPFSNHGLDPVPNKLKKYGVKFWKYGRWNGKHIKYTFYKNNF